MAIVISLVMKIIFIGGGRATEKEKTVYGLYSSYLPVFNILARI